MMLLFRIGIDPVLTTLQENERFGIETEAGRITCLTYANDLALIAKTIECLQTMVGKATEIVSWTSMKLNPSKCGYLSVPSSSENINIYHTNIPIDKDEEGYRYLGVDCTRKTKNTP